jgi:hypothetical protein
MGLIIETTKSLFFGEGLNWQPGTGGPKGLEILPPSTPTGNDLLWGVGNDLLWGAGNNLLWGS